MRHASLFSGIGGFDLAAQWMGWENVFQVEIDGFCQKVLKKNFPGVARYGDIKQFDGTKYRGAVDILTGGFPCQPYSTAGKRKGKEDDRHLWPEMLRVIREVQPGYVVGENVRGLTNWSGGLVFDEVQADLEIKGYEVLPFLLPACAINAPHRRDRVWFIAHTNSERQSISTINGDPRCGKLGEIFTDAYSQLRGHRHNGEIAAFRATEKSHEGIRHTIPNSKQWYAEPILDRVVDGIPNRVDRIRSLGNAVVPALVFEIFKAIESVNQERESMTQKPRVNP